MARRLPEGVSAPTWQEPKPQEKWELKLKVITPMFGGGYETRKVDPVNIIRPAAIRGHLRFWWRAITGAQFRTPEELYKAESAIWGGAVEKGKEEKCVGKVAITVKVTANGNGKKYSEIAPILGYFLFPFRGQGGDGPAPEASRKGVEFTLTIVLAPQLSCQQKDGVRLAIQAWLAFGGVGSRTRRGCGALQVVGNNANQWMLPADSNARRAWFQALTQAEQSQPQWTALGGATVVIGSSKQDAMQIWSELAKFWARFRKGHVGTNIQYSPMSGTKWRDYRGELVEFGKNPKDSLRLAKPFWGLPILYQKFRNAPYAPTIESESSGRMSSPVILKPLALANGQFVPMVAVLSAPSPKKIKIKNGQNQGDSITLLPPDRQNDPVMKELQVTTALEAVIVAAKKHVGQEVIRLGGGA